MTKSTCIAKIAVTLLPLGMSLSCTKSSSYHLSINCQAKVLYRSFHKHLHHSISIEPNQKKIYINFFTSSTKTKCRIMCHLQFISSYKNSSVENNLKLEHALNKRTLIAKWKMGKKQVWKEKVRPFERQFFIGSTKLAYSVWKFEEDLALNQSLPIRSHDFRLINAIFKSRNFHKRNKSTFWLTPN